MNASRFAAVFAFVAVTGLVAARSAHAEEAEIGIGAGVTAASSQVQADLEFHRRLALELAVGEPIVFGTSAVTAGGRLYLTRTFLAPYVGVMASRQTASVPNLSQADAFTSERRTLAGPTVGLRLRGRRFGAFGEAEILQDVDQRNTFVLPGLGVQYFF